MLLDQYGAADVIVPQVRLQRVYPGGPIIGHFSAFFGPDKKPLGHVTLRVSSAAGLPKLLDAGVKRLDAIYAAALARGVLRPDTSLVIEQPQATAWVRSKGARLPFRAATSLFSLTRQMSAACLRQSLRCAVLRACGPPAPRALRLAVSR
jgi:hypothetical protein